MALPIQHKSTIQDFESYTQLPQNNERIFELISGDIIEVPSNPYVSEIANLISFFIRLFLRENQLKGHITGADGGFIINGDVYAPDVAYISYERQPQLAKKDYNPNPPELAVEVISDPTNGQEQTILRRKIINYINAGVIVWVVNPDEKTVEVYMLGEVVKVYTVNDLLTINIILPDFKLPVKEIFSTPEID